MSPVSEVYFTMSHRVAAIAVALLITTAASAQTPEPSPVPAPEPRPVPVRPPPPAVAPAAPSSVPSSPAPRRGPSVELVGEFGVELGGDEVAELRFTNGESQTLTAGQGGTFAGGVLVRPSADSRFGLRTTGGFKFVLNASENADVRLTRIPLEVVGTLGLGHGVQVGVGVVHHTAVRLEGDGFLDSVDFQPATGFTAEIGWRLLSVHATVMGYEDGRGATLDASSVGLTLRGGHRVR